MSLLQCLQRCCKQGNYCDSRPSELGAALVRNPIGFYSRNELDHATGLAYYYLFEEPTYYVVLSNLFIPHILNYRPMETMASTKGFYILKIQKTDQLSKVVEAKLRSIGANDGVRIRGNSKENEEELRSLFSDGIKIQGTTSDGTRIDIIRSSYAGRNLLREIINPIRPSDADEKYLDQDLEAVDALFHLLWSQLM